MGSLFRNECSLAHPRCGRGFRNVALCLAKIEPFIGLQTPPVLKFGYWLSCSLCFRAKCRLLAKGCGFFVPKWVWLGIWKMPERFQSRSSLFSQNRAILLAFRLLQHWNSATGCLALCFFPAKCRLLAKGCGFFVPKSVWLGISLVREMFQSRSSRFNQNRAILLAFRLL